MKFRSSLDKYRRGKSSPLRHQSPTVTIDSLSNEGDGVARLDGEAVFVPNTAPGDTVVIEIVEKRKRWSRGKLVRLVTASPDRVTPLCAYVERCGGCSWQHIDYPVQLKIKQQQLLDTLRRIGSLTSVNSLDIVPSPDPFSYRNRIRGVVLDESFHFHATGSDELVPISQCVIAAPPINQYLKSSTTQFPKYRQSIELAVVRDNTVDVLDLNDDRTTALGFRQVNDAVSTLLNQAVYELIKQEVSSLDTTGNENQKAKLSLLDLYCGHGNWSIRIAQNHPNLRVVGVDVSEHNIKSARLAAADVKNASFIKNKAEKILSQPDNQPDYIIVDPPRGGLSTSVVDALNTHPVKMLLYISCHPATLARDLAKLHEGAYTIESVQAFDMFPQTPHVETLTVLRVR